MANSTGWNYHNEGAPEFMEFGGPSRGPNIRHGYRGGRSERRMSDWRHHGPAIPRGEYRPQFQSQRAPPQQYFRSRAPNRGFEDARFGAQHHFATGSYTGRVSRPYRGHNSRGAHGHGNQEIDIAAYFHPSMLENPWPSTESWRGSSMPNPPAQPAESPCSVNVEMDDPELQAILQEIKQKKESDQVTSGPEPVGAESGALHSIDGTREEAGIDGWS